MKDGDPVWTSCQKLRLRAQIFIEELLLTYLTFNWDNLSNWNEREYMPTFLADLITICPYDLRWIIHSKGGYFHPHCLFSCTCILCVFVSAADRMHTKVNDHKQYWMFVFSHSQLGQSVCWILYFNVHNHSESVWDSNIPYNQHRFAVVLSLTLFTLRNWCCCIRYFLTATNVKPIA